VIISVPKQIKMLADMKHSCSFLEKQIDVNHIICQLVNSELSTFYLTTSYLYLLNFIELQQLPLPEGLLWSWSYGSWNLQLQMYLQNVCNQCLSPLMLWVRISVVTQASCTWYNIYYMIKFVS